MGICSPNQKFQLYFKENSVIFPHVNVTVMIQTTNTFLRVSVVFISTPKGPPTVIMITKADVSVLQH